MKNKLSKWKFVLTSVTAAVMLLSSISFVTAAEFVAPESDEGNLVLASGEVYNNLYAVGGNVTINSNITGDLIVAGGNVTIEGSVEKDLIVAGGTVYVNGAVGEDLRVAGGNVTINGTIGGDLLAAAGSLLVSERSNIGGDAVFTGGEVDLSAPVTGRLKASGGNVTINSAITGEAEIVADSKVTFGSAAVLGANAVYKAPEQATIRDGAQVSEVRYEEYSRADRGKGNAGAIASIFTIGFLIKLAAMIIAALVLFKMFPRTANTMVNNLGNHPWLSLLVGFIAMIVAPIAAVLLFISLIGFYLGLIILAIWIAYMIVSALLAAVFIGVWITKQLVKKDTLVVDWQSIVIGVVVLGIISVIPVIGWLFILLVWLAAFGTILRFIYHHIKQGEGGEVVVVEDQA